MPKTWQNASYLWSTSAAKLLCHSFKYVNNAYSSNMKEVIEYASQGRISSRTNYAILKVPFRKTNLIQKSLSGTNLEQLPSSIKRNKLKTFKHDGKNIIYIN